jgi:hypothetical protein
MVSLHKKCASMFVFLTLCSSVIPPPEKPLSFFEWTSTNPSIFQRIPELVFLTEKEIPLPKDSSFSEEKSLSQVFFQKPFAELEHTRLSLQCLEWILEGSDRAFEALTLAQPPPLRLQKKSFLSLHKQALHLLEHHPPFSPSQMKFLLEKNLLLQSLENSIKFRASFGIKALDPNEFKTEFFALVKEKPSLFPSFSSLSKEESDFLSSSYHFCNFSSIFSLEGGRKMFQPIKEKLLSGTNALFALDFHLFGYLCFLSGGLAHLNSSSSLALTQETYLAFTIAKESCHLLSESKKQEEDAYNYCVERRASLLHLELKKTSDQTLVRIAALLRLFSPQEGALLKEAFHSLSYADRESILLQFQEKKAPQTAPCYLPSFLMNVFNDPSSGPFTKDKLKNTIARALPLLSQIFKDARERVELGLLHPNIALSFQKAAAFAKEHPSDLPLASYQIDKEGQVTLFIDPETKKP